MMRNLLAVVGLAMLASQPPPTTFNDMFPAWSPDGRQVAFTSDRDGDPEIYRVGLDGAGLERLTRTPGRDAHPAWSPDGRQIVFQSPRNDGQTRLFLMNADGTNQRPITANTGFCGVPAWSPDGRRLAFQCSDSMTTFGTAKAPWRVFTLDLPDGAPMVRTSGPGNDQVPNWSPDGSRLVFYSDRSGVDQLYTLELVTGTIAQITRPPGAYRGAAFAPDGRQIGFLFYPTAGPADIYVMNLDGTSRRRVTTLGLEHGLPLFSPDGARILFQKADTAGSRIWITDRDGREARPIDTRSGR
jgi:TolB protein